MSGQSAGLSISEAKAMIKRTEAPGSQSQEHQGGKNVNLKDTHTMKKEKHQGKC